MGKNLPPVDFHASIAQRNPDLAARLVQEGVTSPSPAASPRLLEVVKPKQKSRKGLVQRADGHEAGRITLYVPADLGLWLRRHCFETEQTMSDVAGRLLISALEQFRTKQ